MADFYSLFKPILQRRANRKRQILRKIEKEHWGHDQYQPNSKITPVTATFIYHQPPDYNGVPADHWEEREWVSEFERLKLLGIDTVVHQGAVAERLDGCWYLWYQPSQNVIKSLNPLTIRLKKSPVETPKLNVMIKAAERTNIKLYLGLVNLLGPWFSNPTQKLLDEIVKQQITVAEDLINNFGKSSAIYGWYIPPEFSHLLHGFLKRLNCGQFLQEITTFLKNQTPTKSIMISPITHYNTFFKSYAYHFWINTLKNSGVDILAPQDSVGVLNVTPKQSPKIWQFWRSVANEAGVQLWANCESFERVNYSIDHPLVAAPFKRFLWQLEAVTPFVDKIITWEAMHFLNDNSLTSAEGGTALLAEYRQLFHLS
jgi:hypothetical protein